eukprot:TRINITY_DN4531_c0_g1_i2.p1 TRINITY_DN4531_c0_g1~~TRINITY_DN4531_c0_g1_i2.p1  ORF type:complete len:229 (-),score=26.19 TRINITY_DN4531_c0_g1_i2:904-1590(-)
MDTAPMGDLTSGASGRIIPVFRNIRRSVPSITHIFIIFQAFFLWFFLLLQRNRLSASSKTAAAAAPKRKALFRKAEEEADASRRRALAEGLEMDNEGVYRWSTEVFYGPRRNALFSRSWVPVSGEIKGIMIIIHGLNEHSGRYAYFARQLTTCSFGVYAMDWIGHGGSDGLHGYVPSLDHVVEDTVSSLDVLISHSAKPVISSDVITDYEAKVLESNPVSAGLGLPQL